MRSKHMEKHRIIFILFFFSSLYLKAQSSDKIVYEFQDTINEILLNEINYEIKIRGDKLSLSDFCIEYSYCKDVESFSVNLITEGALGELIRRSNRVVYIKNEPIPIYFGHDLVYSTLFKIKKGDLEGRIYVSGFSFILRVENKKVKIYR